MSFNICRGTLGSLAMFTAIRNASSRVSRLAADRGQFSAMRNATYWPISAAPVVRLLVRYRRQSCRASQSTARKFMGYELPRRGQNAASALSPEAAATVTERCVR
jgi:hypothetical protein